MNSLSCIGCIIRVPKLKFSVRFGSIKYDYGLFMDCLWIVYGLFMDCLWIVYGLFMDCLWIVYGLFMDCLWIVYGLFMDCLWIVYGLFMDCLWIVYGLFMDCLWIVYGLFWRFSVWRMAHSAHCYQGRIQKKNWQWIIWNFNRYCAMHLRAEAHLGLKASRRLA